MNERIKKLRKTLDLTQQEFGRRIGMKQNTIALIESGRNTSDQTILAICREFGANEEWLRTGEGPMFLPEDREGLAFLQEKYPGLTAESLVFIEKLIKLPASKQNVIMDFLRDVVSGFEESTVEEPDHRKELHDELDRQLDLEDGAMGESSVS